MMYLLPVYPPAFMMKHIPHSQFSLESQLRTYFGIDEGIFFLGCLNLLYNPLFCHLTYFERIVLICWSQDSQDPKTKIAKRLEIERDSRESWLAMMEETVG